MEKVKKMSDFHTQNAHYEAAKRSTPRIERSLSASSEYDKLRDDFFTNISHELRTPINVVLGSIQLFEMMGDDLFLSYNRNKFKTYNRIMKQNCYRLLRLVNNLIDVTQMDSGNVRLFLANHNVIEFVREIVSMAKTYAESKNLSLVFKAKEEELITAFDKEKIGRVILNLISNAIKFTPAGGVINVTVKKKENRVHISVKDSGIGIPSDKLDLIFERFSQVDSTLTRNYEGSGIGLSLCSSIVKLHGGLIRVKSQPDKGSEFTVELPLKVLEDDSVQHEKAREIEPSPAENVSIELSDVL